MRPTFLDRHGCLLAPQVLCRYPLAPAVCVDIGWVGQSREIKWTSERHYYFAMQPFLPVSITRHTAHGREKKTTGGGGGARDHTTATHSPLDVYSSRAQSQ